MAVFPLDGIARGKKTVFSASPEDFARGPCTGTIFFFSLAAADFGAQGPAERKKWGFFFLWRFFFSLQARKDHA